MYFTSLREGIVTLIDLTICSMFVALRVGIAAASFASVTGNGIREREMGFWDGFWERGKLSEQR